MKFKHVTKQPPDETPTVMTHEVVIKGGDAHYRVNGETILVVRESGVVVGYRNRGHLGLDCDANGYVVLGTAFLK